MVNKIVFVAALLCLIVVPCIAEDYTLYEGDQIVAHGDQEFYGFAKGAFATIGDGASIGFDYNTDTLTVFIILDEYPREVSDFGYYFYLASIKCDEVAREYPGKIGNIDIYLEVDGERIAQMRTLNGEYIGSP